MNYMNILNYEQEVIRPYLFSHKIILILETFIWDSVYLIFGSNYYARNYVS